MNIRRFDKWDDLISEYNKNIAATNEQMTDLNNQKQATLNEYNTNYQNQLNEYDNLMAQQQNVIDTYKQNQEDALQKNYQSNLDTINQNKQETQEQINKEKKDSYVDYMKQINQYGGAAEQLASQGLANTGYAESSKIAMYNTYQNRVSAAQTALTKANVEYDRQMTEAKNNYDVGLAQVALTTLQQSYQLALQGFEYKNTLFNNKTNFELQVEDNYFNKGNTLQNRIDNYRSAIANINQYREQMAEEKRQFNASLAAKNSGGGLSINYGDTPGYTTSSKNSATWEDLGSSLKNTGTKGEKVTGSGTNAKVLVKNTGTLKLSSSIGTSYINQILKSNNGKYISIADLETTMNQLLKSKVIDENDYIKVAKYLGLGTSK